MDQLDQDITRFKKPGMAAVGGVAAALVIATLPAVYLEKAIGMTGISEIVSAAAPPLGNTAKALIAVFAGLVSASLIFLFLNRKGEGNMGLPIRKLANWEEEKAEWEKKTNTKKSKFSLGSLKKLLQKPKKKNEVKDLEDLPKLREADSHPDAPVRQPIFADKDLGAPLDSKIKPFDQAEQAAPVEEPAAAPELTPAPFVMDKSLQAPEPAEAPLDLSGQVSVPPVTQPVAETVAAPIQEPAAAAPAPAVEVSVEPQEDMSGLSIGQLTDRLEAGLGRLKQLEQMRAKVVSAEQPVTAPEAPAAAPAQEPAVGGISVTSTEAAPSVPPALKSVEPSPEDINAKRQADMDAALKAALGTLEKMTAQR